MSRWSAKRPKGRCWQVPAPKVKGLTLPPRSQLLVSLALLVFSAAAGEVLTIVIDSGDGWVDCTNADGARGLIPKNYMA